MTVQYDEASQRWRVVDHDGTVHEEFESNVFGGDKPNSQLLWENEIKPQITQVSNPETEAKNTNMSVMAWRWIDEHSNSRMDDTRQRIRNAIRNW